MMYFHWRMRETAPPFARGEQRSVHKKTLASSERFRESKDGRRS